MMEAKQVPFAEDYLVTIDGRVWHRKGDRCVELKQDISTKYPRVKIHGKKHYVARLMAESWLPKIYPSCTYVKHKNGDTTDNHLENLEWTTLSDLHK